MDLRTTAIAAVGMAMMLTQASHARAAEVVLLTTKSIAVVLDEIRPEFERTTGHKVAMKVDLAPVLQRRIDAGEEFDVAAFAETFIDQLISQGKLAANTRAGILRAGIGVAVQAGAPRPDISSVKSFKQALLKAQSIAYLKEGASGVYLAGMLERLGLADVLRRKTMLLMTDTVSELVAKGQVEIGMIVIPNILATPGAELLGPLPAELQFYINFPAGVSARAKNPEAAQELIRFLKGRSATKVIRSKGMEPL